MSTAKPLNVRQRDRIAVLTEEARRNPAAFFAKFRRLMALAGWYVRGVLVFLGLVLVAALWSVPQGGGLAAMFLILIAGSSLFYLLASIGRWAKVDPGVRLKRSQLPKLFDLIDEVRSASGLKALHGIHLSADFNAYVTVIRKRGIFGRSENHLVIGVPLMHALAPQEFRAVLAHECGHLSSDQSKDILAMAHLESMWQNVSAGMGDSFGGMLFYPFFRWFNPRFNAHRIVYRREQELAADRESVSQTDHETATTLAVRAEVAGLKLQELAAAEHTRLFREHETPPKGLTAGLCALAATPITDEDKPYLVLALARQAGWGDVHPAMSERLRAMGIDPGAVELPPPVEESAAERYIGGHMERLCDALDDTQRPKIHGFWALQHARVAHDVEALRQLDQDARFGDLTPADQLKRAMLLALYEPKEPRTLQILEEVYASGETTDVDLLWELGRARLRADDPTGIELIEESVTLRPDITAEAFAALAAHHARTGDVDAAKKALSTAADIEADNAEVDAQCGAIGDKTPVEPHRLKAHELVGLRQPLERQPAVAEAWLVKRRFESETITTRYILLVRDTVDGTAFFPGKARAELYHQLSQTLAVHGEITIVALDEPVYGLWRRMAAVPGSRIYLKPGETAYTYSSLSSA